MSAGGGDDEGALGELLAADVGEVEAVGVEAGVELVDVGGDRGQVELPGEQADGLGEGADAVDADGLDDGGLAGVGGGDDEARQAAGGGAHGHGEGAADGADGAVSQGVGLELAGGEEQGQGDGQGEAGGVLLECRRGRG